MEIILLGTVFTHILVAVFFAHGIVQKEIIHRVGFLEAFGIALSASGSDHEAKRCGLPYILFSTHPFIAIQFLDPFLNK